MRLTASPLLPQVPPLVSQGTTEAAVRNVETALNELPGGSLTNLTSLLPRPGVEPRYVAVGGSLTAGVRNGGLYREAQLTSYPNLLARQMGLRTFRQPLFGVEQGNGSGYLKLVQSDPVPRFNRVANNLAVAGNGPLTFTPYREPVDNLGFPYLGIHHAWGDEEWRLNPMLGPGVPYEPAFRPYFRRLLPEGDAQWLTRYVPYVLQQKADFMTVELGLDDVLWYASAGGYRLASVMTQLDLGEGSPIIALLNHLQRNQMRGAVATVPDVLAFPYFKLYSVAKVRQQNGGATLFTVVDDRYELLGGGTQFIEEVADKDILLPTPKVDSLAFSKDATTKKGLSRETPLSSRDVLSEHERELLGRVGWFNDFVRFQASRFSVPVVDLHALYAKILTGDYTTHDGVKIDPAYPTGNFFSQDGLSPTALGQAVIANEWIKTINQHYLTRIPLVNTALFVQRFKE